MATFTSFLLSRFVSTSFFLSFFLSFVFPSYLTPRFLCFYLYFITYTLCLPFLYLYPSVSLSFSCLSIVQFLLFLFVLNYVLFNALLGSSHFLSSLLYVSYFLHFICFRSVTPHLSLVFLLFSFFYFPLFSITFSLTPCSLVLTFFHLSSMFLIFFILFVFVLLLLIFLLSFYCSVSSISLCSQLLSL